MTPHVDRYGVDPSGVSPDNRVQGEVRQLISRPRRAIIPMYGAFFPESLIIVDMQTGIELRRNEHYDIMGLYTDATERFGKEVAAIIVIKSPVISNTVSLTYQCAGGPYQSTLRLVADLAKNLADDDRELLWEAISGKPSSYYPAHHFHDIGDAYGFDPLVNSIETLRLLSLAGDRAAQDDLYLNVDRRVALLSSAEEKKGKTLLDAHLANPEAHPVYAKATDIIGQRPIIRQPINGTPLANATGLSIQPVLQRGTYNNAYRIPMRYVQFQISRTVDFATIADDSGVIKPTDSYTCKTKLLFNTDHYWRYRYSDDENNQSTWSTPTKFRTGGN